MEILSFPDALSLEPEPKRRSVLLGNGFSIACRPRIFTYGALFERADFKALRPTARAAFDALESRDFELVMRALRLSAPLAALYARDKPEIAAEMERDAEALREVLVRTIADSHPDYPAEIHPHEYDSARVFLAHFNRVYSLSYDLLLYWTAMQDSDSPLAFDDGFRTPDEGPEEYVTWEIEKTDSQRAFYLHGALHLFDAGYEIKKFTWANTGQRLIDQIRAALSSELFPLIVTEGRSEQKLEKINHSNYLSRGYRSFSKIGNALYTFGVAFSDNDDHLLHLIRKNLGLRVLAAAVYGDPKEPANQQMIGKIYSLNDHRPEKRQLVVRLFDAESAHVWDNPATSPFAGGS